MFSLVKRAISWKGAKQSFIATSTMKAKFVACYEATIHKNLLQNFIARLEIVDTIAKPLKIYYDNSVTMFFYKNMYSKCAKHMKLNYLNVKF